MPTSSDKHRTGFARFNITNPNGTTNLVTVPYYLATDRIDPTLTSINAGFSVANAWYNSHGGYRAQAI